MRPIILYLFVLISYADIQLTKSAIKNGLLWSFNKYLHIRKTFLLYILDSQFASCIANETSIMW